MAICVQYDPVTKKVSYNPSTLKVQTVPCSVCDPVIFYLQNDGTLKNLEGIAIGETCYDGLRIAANNDYVVIAFWHSLTNRRIRLLKKESLSSVWESDLVFSTGVSDVAIDSNNDILIAMGNDRKVLKYNINKEEQWSYNTTHWTNCVEVDNSNNVYIGTCYPYQGWVIKLNSAGTEQWTTVVGGRVSCLSIDSSGNVYCGCSGAKVRKLNSSGVIQWVYVLMAEYDNGYPTVRLSVDGNDDVIVIIMGWYSYWDETDVDDYPTYEWWYVNTQYDVDDLVTYEEYTWWYKCVQSHVSTTDNRPGTGVNWEDYWVRMPRKSVWKLDGSKTRIWQTALSSIQDVKAHSDNSFYLGRYRPGTDNLFKYNSTATELWNFNTNQTIRRIVLWSSRVYTIGDK